MPIVQLIA